MADRIVNNYARHVRTTVNAVVFHVHTLAVFSQALPPEAMIQCEYIKPMLLLSSWPSLSIIETNRPCLPNDTHNEHSAKSNGM